ncbi:MAG: hypothetical protein ACR2QF_03510 [Geminicoccaceae bacterium]
MTLVKVVAPPLQHDGAGLIVKPKSSSVILGLPYAPKPIQVQQKRLAKAVFGWWSRQASDIVTSFPTTPRTAPRQ